MSAQDHDGTGSKDRATVALVNAKLDEIKAIIKGNAETQTAEMKALSLRIDSVAKLPEQVNAQHEMISLLQARVTVLENSDGQDAARRAARPMFYISLVAAAAAVGSVIVAYIH